MGGAYGNPVGRPLRCTMPVTITCPLCQSPEIETQTDVPNLIVCKCKACSTAFVIAAKVPSPTH